MINKFILALIFISIYTSCHQKESKTEINTSISKDENTVILTDNQLKNVDIQTSILSKNKISKTLRTYGRTFFPSENMTTITSSFGGMIKSLSVIQGQYVSKGQVIAILEDPGYIDLQQDYLLAKSKLKLAEQDYERQRELNISKANSDKVYQLAENEWRTQKIMLRALAEKLTLLGINPKQLTEQNITRRVSLRASASGYISTIYSNLGKYISPSENILDIIQLSRPLLKIKLYEKDLNQIYLGMSVKTFQSNDTSKIYHCVIKSISPLIASDGSSEIICSFQENQKNILQNMNMIADILLTSGDANSLPNEAIVHFEGQNYLFMETKHHTYKMFPVMIGNSIHGLTEILNSEEFINKKIVTKNAYALLMALKNKD